MGAQGNIFKIGIWYFFRQNKRKITRKVFFYRVPVGRLVNKVIKNIVLGKIPETLAWVVLDMNKMNELMSLEYDSINDEFINFGNVCHTSLIKQLQNASLMFYSCIMSTHPDRTLENVIRLKYLQYLMYVKYLRFTQSLVWKRQAQLT